MFDIVSNQYNTGRSYTEQLCNSTWAKGRNFFVWHWGLNSGIHTC
jgi:hypothetical protein